MVVFKLHFLAKLICKGRSEEQPEINQTEKVNERIYLDTDVLIRPSSHSRPNCRPIANDALENDQFGAPFRKKVKTFPVVVRDINRVAGVSGVLMGLCPQVS